MMDYLLDAQDAPHLPGMELAEVRDILTFDEGFLRIDGLHVWNDGASDAGPH